MNPEMMQYIQSLPPDQRDQAMAKLMAGGGMNDVQMASFKSSLTPEAVSLGTIDERNALLQQQMEAANALRNRAQPQYETGVGAGIGAIGRVIRGIRTHNEAKAARDEIKANADKRDTLRHKIGSNMLGELERIEQARMADALRRKQESEAEAARRKQEVEAAVLANKKPAPQTGKDFMTMDPF